MHNITLRIRETEKTPSLSYDPKAVKFAMKGVSVPDDAQEFYAPIIKWVEDFVADPPTDRAEIHIDLEYFSIKSSKLLLKILRLFEKLPNSVIYWYYDDTDTREIGEDFNFLLKVEMLLVHKPEKE